MNNRFPTFLITSVIALTTLALPGTAAVIDEVKNKVNAIKTDTNTLKTRTSNILGDVREQLSETVDIRGALDPLFMLRERLADLGIEPSELLEMIDLDALREKLDELKQLRQAAQDRLNDPDIETFRTEFLQMMTGVSEIIALQDGVAEVTPLEDLLGNAPRPAVSILKVATMPVFPALQLNVSKTQESLADLRNAGLLELILSPHPNLARVCNAVNLVGTSAAWLYLWKHEQRVEEVQTAWNRLTKRVEEGHENVEWTMPDIGIHGYLSLGLPKKSFVAASMTEINTRKGGLEWHKKHTRHLKEFVRWMGDEADSCDIVFGG